MSEVASGPVSGHVTGPGARRAQVVLAAVVALQLVAETALTPYWPQMFRRIFGTEELAATGTFLTVARVAGLAALPLWGLAALRWPVRTLLVTGLGLSAVFDVALAVAPSWWTFTAFSAGQVACGSVLVLAYPVLVQVTERPGRADRRVGVVTYWVVFHASMVLATVIGASILSLGDPRWGLAAFAVVDLALAAAVLLLVPARPPRGGTPRQVSPATGGGRAARWRRLRPWLALVVAVVAVDAATAVPRPYFVELLVRQDVSAATAGGLFLVPGLASLALLPVTPWLLDRLGRATAPVAALLGGSGLLVQALGASVEETATVLAGRVLLGAGAGVLLVVLDLAVFDRIGTHGTAFSAIETGRQGALLAAPVLATAVAGVWLGAPLLVAAVILVLAGVLLLAARPPLPVLPHPTPTQEIEHVLHPVR